MTHRLKQSDTGGRNFDAGKTDSAAAEMPVPLAIIGGGAAGMFAAAVAAGRKTGCLVFERKARLGTKMLMTANGRCNFTKDISAEKMLSDVGDPVAPFLRKALTDCPPDKIAAGFRKLGMQIKRMTDGRLFPASEKAADVVHALGDLIRNNEVPVVTNCAVTGIDRVQDGTFVIRTKSFSVRARKVLVATGGASFPKTGSVGDGQSFAQSLGLSVTPLRAALTGYDMSPPHVARHENAVARVRINGRIMCEYRGEIEFEKRGVSGAAVYNCQRWTARHLNEPNNRNHEVELEFGGKKLTLKNPASHPLKEAIVTMGGVALSEINPETMESKKIPGLFFAGEVMDVDGPTGGYNLSIAFATARLAVVSAVGGR